MQVSFVCHDREAARLFSRAMAAHGLDVQHIDEVASRADSSVIAVFMDSPADGRRLTETIAALEKPVVFLDPTHDEIAEAAFRQVGAVVAPDSDAFVDVVAALAAGSVPSGSEAGLTTTSTGLKALATSACQAQGLAIIEVETGTCQSQGGSPHDTRTKAREGLILTNAKGQPIVSCLAPGSGVPDLPTPERAVNAYAALVRYAARRPLPRYVPPAVTPMNIEGAGIMDEHEAGRLLDRWGIPVVPGTLVTGPGRHDLTPIRKLATHFGYPVVLKAIQRDLRRKSEQGAIAIGLASNEQLKAAWEAMHERFPDAAWLVQPFLPGDLELVIRGWRHSTFGPVVTLGSGGVLTELYHDVTHRLAPLTRDDALEMIRETKASALLGGFGGLPVHDQGEIAGAIVNVGELMVGQPTVQEVSVDPLLVTEKGPFAVGASAVIA